MQKAATLRGGLLLAAALVAGLVAAFYATRSNGAGTSRSAHVVMTAKNKALGKTILVNRRRMTLYSLSVERRGRFICKNSACLSLWTPLVVRKGTKPTGVSHLATVRRPDGRTQVTYRGGPLYTFKQDRKPGDIKGNGFKDVGTWKVVTVGRSGTMPTPPPPPTYTYPQGY
jgi:predicted lipoprotein with Yx(FWY)xxD motif